MGESLRAGASVHAVPGSKIAVACSAVVSRMAFGATIRCQHLDSVPMQPAFIDARKPDHSMCRVCFDESTCPVHRPMTRCDACGGPLGAGALGSLTVIPPVSIYMRACTSCAKEVGLRVDT